MLIDTDILIIGAGLSGVGFAIRLQQKYPLVTYEVYEKAEELGGTWWFNTYPGCACDVPSHLYSYSFALNPEWSTQFAPRAEIEAYCRSVADKYDIPRHITFRSTVQGATWDEASGTWSVRILDQQTEKVYKRRSRVLISAVGLLSEPNDCEIPGAQDFTGKLFHSARWDHSFDWAGKDVVVIGNGCSATQFVPILSADPGKARSVVQFIRQPHWLEERPNPRYSDATKWIFRNIPLAMRLFRLAIFLYLESYFITFNRRAGKKIREKKMKAQTAYLKRTAPEKYYEALIPKIELGCKRRVMDTAYLACLHRENMELVHADPIECITATGVRTQSGREVNADAIVLATGFKATQFLFPLEIKGEHGVSITEHWQNTPTQVPHAYYSTCISSFPNFFILHGPNTATGHTSVIFTAECQINFALKVLDPILCPLHLSTTTNIGPLSHSPSQSSLRFPSFLTRSRSIRNRNPSSSSQNTSIPPKPSPPWAQQQHRPRNRHKHRHPRIVTVTPEAEARDASWIARASEKYVWTSGCASWYLHPSGRNTTLYPGSQVRFWWRSVRGPRRVDFVYRGCEEKEPGSTGKRGLK
ncbi:hypothetical protein ASPCAL07902 [Aspergillus calidoustus]|uniref:L-ornithine N(5)-oxygenase n=1 Tax=Aspergillus calidoustus TaxID=454130 RepID=A0A0U5HID0_ASPCI|nr:hypothetical protein ASPCAL07902 [Aspergillus calidoustus]